MTIETRGCDKRVYSDAWDTGHPCGRKVVAGGRCSIHTEAAQKARDAKSISIYERKRMQEQARALRYAAALILDRKGDPNAAEECERIAAEITQQEKP